MLDFLKSLFKEKSKEKEEIDFFELSKWLAPKLDLGLGQDFNEMNEINESLMRAIVKLENIDIDSMKVEEKLKGYVNGNRKAYVQSLRLFLKELKAPEKLDHGSVDNFCKNLDKDLGDFNKKTIKNYYIMQQLIGKELEAFKKSLKQIDMLLKRIAKKVKEGKLELIENVLLKLRDIYNYLDDKEVRDNELKTLEKEKSSLIDREKGTRKKVEELRTSHVFMELSESKASKDSLNQRLLDVKSELKSKFVSLARPLRKLAKMYNDRQIDAYLEDPLTALMSDSEFNIVTIFASLKKEIGLGNITEKNLDRILNLVDEMNENYFRNFFEKIRSLRSDINDAERKINENTFEQQIDALAKEISSIERNLADVDEKIEKIKSKIISNDIKEIEESIRKLGFRIEVKNAPYDK